MGCWLLIGMALSGLPGCGPWWWQKLDERVIWESRQIIDERVIGEPDITHVRHADGAGWTVEAREPVRWTVARQGSRVWLGRPLLFAPGLSHLVAAMGCAWIGAETLLIRPVLVPEKSLYYEGLTELCLWPMLGWMPYAPGTRWAKAPTEKWQWFNWREGREPVTEPEATETGWRPLQGAELGLRVEAGPWWWYPIGSQGVGRVRLETLPVGAIPRTGTVELAVRWHRREVERWREPVEEAVWARLANEAAQDAVNWPASLVVGIEPWAGWPEREQARWEQQLREAVAGAVRPRGGHVVMLGGGLRQALERERRRQYSGTVSDEQQVPVGREPGPTVIVRPGYQPRERGEVWIGADVVEVERGVVVATMGWVVPEQSAASAAEAVLGRLAWLWQRDRGT